MSSIEPIVLAVETPASPDDAWHALTDPVVVADWFTEASPLGPVGAPYRLDFGDGSVILGTVRSLVPGRSFSHGWAWAAEPPGPETLVTWSVDPLPEGGCRVTLRHDGWEEAGLDAVARDDHAGYWEAYLADLRDLLAGEAGDGA